MTRDEYLRYCREIPGATVDQPFEEDFETYIVRHTDNRKWFAAILKNDGRDIVNLKCDPIEAEFLRSVYEGIMPGYHMNKTHWNTICFDSDVPDDLLRQLTMASYRLTETKRNTRKRKSQEES